MNKIASVITLTLAASSAQAFITPISGTIDSLTTRASFAPATLVTGSASGSWSAVLDTVGSVFNSGTLNISYTQSTPGYGSSTNTYNNLVYSLSSASGALVDSDYLGTGTWLSRFDFAFTVDNTAWVTGMTAPSAVRTTNGSYLGTVLGNNSSGGNGTLSLQSGTTSCSGSCSIFPLAELGMEGLTILLNVDQNDGFRVLGGQIIIQEVVNKNSSGTFHYTTVGSINENPPAVPLPASAWLMASGLLGLAGLSRKKSR